MHDNFAFDRFVGCSPWTVRTRHQILKLSKTHQSLLISGPVGSGKHLIARAIHQHGVDSSAPFIRFRCDRLPEVWQHLQLFGGGTDSVIQGDFLGAMKTAEQGILFLEDVERLAPSVQRRLLTQLQQPSRPKVRILASTTRDLRDLAGLGRFECQLLRLLSQRTLQTIPLCKRSKDIEPIVRHLVARTTLESGLPLKQLSASALAVLRTYPWEGNVNQVQYVIERAVVEYDEEVLDSDVFYDILGWQWSSAKPSTEEFVPDYSLVSGRWLSLRDAEAHHIRHTLHQTRGRLEPAADLLELSLSELEEKMRHHGIAVHEAGWSSPSC